LMLAQHMVREDKDQAMFRLALSEETAEMIMQLTPRQVLTIATSNSLMSRFRFDDDVVWNLLTSNSKAAAPTNSRNSSGNCADVRRTVNGLKNPRV
jgi:flagellar transcriptional activator FlhD